MPSVLGMVHQNEYFTQLYPVERLKNKKLRIIGPGPTLVYPYGLFDGVAADYKGGVGFFLALNESHTFEFAMGGGLCTNTKAELMALWALLTVENRMGIPLLNIFGDSTVIINWANYQDSMDSPYLSH